MACPAIITGNEFLQRVLYHIDCQAQVIGSYGYQALGQPGSTASVLASGLLTLFIALFGIRLLLGSTLGARDVILDVAKIGIVLTLAFSWPAFRTVVYDLTLEGPAEIASVIQSSSQPASSRTMIERLQAVDNDIVRLTAEGTGRNSGRFLDEFGSGANFAGTALQDDAAFGYSRLLFLAGVIAPLALLRIAAGILLALTPIVAGLYFFTQSRGIFAGWFKGLVFTFGGSIAISIGLAVQLAIVEPWLADALRVRRVGFATPSAPLELFAIMLAFLIIHFALLAIIRRVAFHRGWPTIPVLPDLASLRAQPAIHHSRHQTRTEAIGSAQAPGRVEKLGNSIETMMRREQTNTTARLVGEAQRASRPTRHSTGAERRLGSSYRTSRIRPLRSITQRDNRK